MFKWLERFRKAPASPPRFSPVLHFDSKDGAFEYWCKYGDTAVAIEKTLIAQVVEAGRDPDGRRIITLRVCGDPPFLTVAFTPGRGGPELSPKDLVEWRVLRRVPQFGPGLEWVGVVFAKVAPVLDMTRGFVLTDWFPPDGKDE